MHTINPITLRTLNDVRGELGLKPLTDDEFAWRYMPRAIRVAKAKAQARDPGGEGGGQFIEEGRQGIRIPPRRRAAIAAAKRPSKVRTSMRALSEAGKNFVNNGNGTHDDPEHVYTWEDGRTLTVRKSDVRKHYEDVLQMAREGKTFHPKADPAQLATAKDWYRKAHKVAQDILAEYPNTGLTFEQVTGVLAAVSPRKGWDVWAKDKDGNLKQSGNIVDARRVIDAFFNKSVDGVPLRDMPVEEAKKHTMGGLHDYVETALKILHGQPPEVMTGTKRQSFWNNLTDPEGEYDATIDGWMAAALFRMGMTYSDGAEVDEDALSWVDHEMTQDGQLQVPGAGYIVLADAIREAAQKFGLSPSEAQAIYWVSVGGGSNAAEMWSHQRRAPGEVEAKKAARQEVLKKFREEKAAQKAEAAKAKKRIQAAKKAAATRKRNRLAAEKAQRAEERAQKAAERAAKERAKKFPEDQQ